MLIKGAHSWWFWTLIFFIILSRTNKDRMIQDNQTQKKIKVINQNTILKLKVRNGLNEILQLAVFNIFFLIGKTTQRTQVQLVVLGRYWYNVTNEGWMFCRYRHSTFQTEMFNLVAWKFLTFGSENMVDSCNFFLYRKEQTGKKNDVLSLLPPQDSSDDTNKHLLSDQYRKVIFKHISILSEIFPNLQLLLLLFS